MIRWFFKWLFRLVFAAVALVAVAAVVLLLTYNSILRNVIERNIREQTGMDAEIGRFHLSLTEPTIEIQNLKIYNSTNFGGALFLDIPEIHIEYDRVALVKRELHITLMRFNLNEMDIVKNQAGQTNIFSLEIPLPAKKNRGIAVKSLSFEKRTGFKFKGIDVLNVSIGAAKFVDLKNPALNRTLPIHLQNIIIKNVKSPADLAGLAALVYFRGGYMLGLPGGPQPKIIIRQ